MKTLTNMSKIRLIGALLVMCTTAAWASCWGVQAYQCLNFINLSSSCNNTPQCTECDNLCGPWCLRCVQVSTGGAHGCYINTGYVGCVHETFVYQNHCGSINPSCGSLVSAGVWFDGVLLPCQAELVEACPERNQ
jgi:hypothetical protein